MNQDKSEKSTAQGETAAPNPEGGATAQVPNEVTAGKLKSSRARIAGWLTRALNQMDDEDVAVSQDVRQLLKERISSQLKRLQACHEKYIGVLDDEDELEEAEDWMEKYFQGAKRGLAKLDRMNQKEREAYQTASQPTSKSSLSAQVRMSNDAEVNPPDPVNSTPNSEDPSQSAGSSTSSTASSSLDSTSSAQPVPTELKPIDAWIEELVPGEETFLPSPATSDLSQAIARLEIERDLPRVELPLFDGTAIMWPRFVEQFYIQVHSRPGLTDSRRMDLLQSHLKGEAKRLIQGLGYSGRNYVQALKELKFVFGHRVSVARAYVNVLTNGGIIPSCDSCSSQFLCVS
jgi:hypothetical protein